MELSRTFPDATTLAREHRGGQRDPRATVRAILQRVHVLQERLNAFAAIDDEGANARAAELADAIACGKDTGPLAGVPVCVKDILDVAGLPTRWGSRLMAQAPPAKSDIAAVARLRAAGAVVIGKTTTTEFAHSPLGFSPLTGLTRNPWAPGLTCGGSSAGAGVAVATGLSSLSLATDAGCSTRLPAACTGIFGIKPTLGTAPHDRVPEAFANFIHLGITGADGNRPCGRARRHRRRLPRRSAQPHACQAECRSRPRSEHNGRRSGAALDANGKSACRR